MSAGDIRSVSKLLNKSQCLRPTIWAFHASSCWCHGSPVQRPPMDANSCSASGLPASSPSALGTRGSVTSVLSPSRRSVTSPEWKR